MDHRHSSRYASLDLWRGLACSMVVLFHALGRDVEHTAQVWLGLPQWLADRLWAGVPIFFVVSGYCIAAAADRTLSSNLPMRQYFLRRLKRIFPPLWFMLLISAVVVAGAFAVEPRIFAHHVRGFSQIQHPRILSPLHWGVNASLAFMWLRPLSVALEGPFWRFLDVPIWMGHTWTLAYEEQFYIVVGLAVLMARRTWGAVVLAITAVSITLAITDAVEVASVNGWFFDGWWLPFGLGNLLFLSLHGERKRGWTSAFGLAAMIAILYGFTEFTGTAAERWRSAWFVAGCTAVLMFAAHRFDRELASWAPLRPLHAIGVRCYSVYLVHWPIVKAASSLPILTSGPIGSQFTVVVVSCGATCIVAWPFYQHIEQLLWQSSVTSSSPRIETQQAAVT